MSLDLPSDPDATSIYDLRGTALYDSEQEARQRHLANVFRQEVAGLREALASGWDVALELEHAEHQLAALEDL